MELGTLDPAVSWDRCSNVGPTRSGRRELDRRQRCGKRPRLGRIIGGLALASVLAGACGSSSSEDDGPAAEDTVPASASASTTAPAPQFAVYPVDSAPLGRTYGEWVAEWWQWSMSHPLASHPLDQAGDVDCAGGRTGKPVWFLGAVITASTTISRRCAIAANTALFFPLFNVECSTLEPPPFHGEDEPSLRSCAQSVGMSGFQLSVDGVEIPSKTLEAFFVTTPTAFTVDVPADNILSVPGPASGKAVGAGVHVMLKPLPAGRHIIHFGGGATQFDVKLDITYEIDVQD
jgi:hypothetical protein